MLWQSKLVALLKASVRVLKTTKNEELVNAARVINIIFNLKHYRLLKGEQNENYFHQKYRLDKVLQRL